MLYTRDNRHIKLVPATRSEIRAVPVGEKGGNGALLVGCLHACDKLAIGELLVGRNRAALELSIRYSESGKHGYSEFHA